MSHCSGTHCCIVDLKFKFLLLQVANLVYHTDRFFYSGLDWMSVDQGSDARASTAFSFLKMCSGTFNCIATWLFLQEFSLVSETQLVLENMCHRPTLLNYQTDSRFRKQFDQQNTRVAAVVITVWFLYGVALSLIFPSNSRDVSAWHVPLRSTPLTIVCEMLLLWPFLSAAYLWSACYRSHVVSARAFCANDILPKTKILYKSNSLDARQALEATQMCRLLIVEQGEVQADTPTGAPVTASGENTPTGAPAPLTRAFSYKYGQEVKQTSMDKNPNRDLHWPSTNMVKKTPRTEGADPEDLQGADPEDLQGSNPDEQYSRLVRAYRRLCSGLQVFSIQWSCFTFFMIANVTKSIRLMYSFVLTDVPIHGGTSVQVKTFSSKLSAGILATTYAIVMISLIIKFSSISQTHARLSMVLKYALPWGKYDNNDVATIESIQTQRGSLNVSIVGTTFQITPFFSYALALTFVACVSFTLKAFS